MERMRTPLWFFGVMLVGSYSVVLGQAMPAGELGGQVRDEGGVALPGVNMTARSEELGVSRETTTDSLGRFRFPGVQPGRYTVSATLSGFATVMLTENLVETSRKTDLSITMNVSREKAAITVTGEVPIVDKTNASLEMRQRQQDLERMPLNGRSYQNLSGNAPGANLVPVPTSSGTNFNPSIHGSLFTNNLWLFDGVDTTDPVTGTWGGNLNFEAIAEITVTTAGVSAEYGRATGGIINVVTRSGTNVFSGSGKVILTNDIWNAQNTTESISCPTATTCTHPSLARTKYDHVNPRYAFTLGGPFWKDHVWFFGTYETAETTGSQQSTPVSLENFQQTTKDRFWEAKVTAQLTPSLAASVRGLGSPTSGFIFNYGNPAEFIAYTGQDQRNEQYAGFLTGVFGPSVTAEIQYNWNGPGNSSSKHWIDIYSLGGGVPHLSEANGYYYNGAFFADSFTNRPRQGALGAVTFFTNLDGTSHNLKAGIDYQHLDSAQQLAYPGNQLFIDKSFDILTRAFVPDQRQDYGPPMPSTSTGDIIALYARDKFDLGRHLFLEIGLRYEHQKSRDDSNRTIVDTGTVSPRVSVSYDVFGTSTSLIVATFGRLYQFIGQSFSDSFTENAQRGTYDNFVWNGSSYVFSNHVAGSVGAARIPRKLDPTYVDEGTLGFRQRIGNTIGVSLTGIYRRWKDFIDDVLVFDSSGNRTITYTNSDPARRKFYGAEIVFDKRFSEHWNASASYAWGKTTGNDFNAFGGSSLGNYLNSNCRTTIDTTIGAGGVIPCSIVTEGANTMGQPALSINNTFKAFGTYSQSVGPANLAFGLAGLLSNGIHYQKQRTMNVLIPGTTRNAGPFENYFYESRGSETTPSIYRIDLSLEATYPLYRAVELGVKGEVLNATNVQRQLDVNNTAWCDDATAGPATPCAVSRATFGTATARGAFQAPRNYRLTALIRF